MEHIIKKKRVIIQHPYMSRIFPIYDYQRLQTNQYKYKLKSQITNNTHKNINNQIIKYIQNKPHETINKYINGYNIISNHKANILTQYIITNNINISLFISNSFNTKLLPNKIILCTGAHQIMIEDNAGGESELSEAFSCQVLYKCLNAKLLKTEMQIKYISKRCKITDYLIEINDIKIGV
eukprot:491568_1